MAIGTAALIKDLKQRDMLKILWCFGQRNLVVCLVVRKQGAGSQSVCFYQLALRRWHKGVLLQVNQISGASKPLDRENPTQVYDIHATMLHLLGIDHKLNGT